MDDPIRTPGSHKLRLAGDNVFATFAQADKNGGPDRVIIRAAETGTLVRDTTNRPVNNLYGDGWNPPEA